jgi:hypothetical protein
MPATWVIERGAVLAVPVDRLRALVAHDAAFGDLIPARLADPPLDPDRARHRPAHHRLAVLRPGT